ncbi:MAG: zinc ribbon domain-containing protein [Methanobacterium paludis]|nr:zinc ribbon domain-containing protein [Methanobacterium paludis]
MHCPICGLKNSGNSKICKSCGKDLKGGRDHLKIARYKQVIAMTLPVVLLIIFIATTKYGYEYFQYLGYTILFIAGFSILFLETRSPSYGQHSRYCPNCEHSNFNEKFCIKCGYNLEDILGYFITTNHDIEMNRNYINIYRKYASESADDMVKLAPETFKLNKIRNLRVSSCKTLFSNKPCLKFEYMDEKCKSPARKHGDKCIVKMNIDKKNEYEINSILCMGIYSEALSPQNV